jgi:hypothetical protein
MIFIAACACQQRAGGLFDAPMASNAGNETGKLMGLAATLIKFNKSIKLHFISNFGEVYAA